MIAELALLLLAPLPDLEDGWLVKYETAVKVAKNTGKPMLVNFTGSDWCSYCHVLDNQVFSTPEFGTWSRDNVVLLKLDFPQQKEIPQWMKDQNQDLMEKYQVQGFPTIIFMDAEGQPFGQAGLVNDPGPNPWIRNANMILMNHGEKPVSYFGGVDYPPFVKDKTLYAKNDYRGKKAPSFEFGTWIGGKAPNMKGKIVVVDFWATWCGPCRALIPEMNKWAQEFKDDVVFIGLSDEEPGVVKEFMATTKISYPVANDPAGKSKGVVGVEGIPHGMVMTPDGIVRWQGFPQDGKDRLTADMLKQIIRAWKSSQAEKV